MTARGFIQDKLEIKFLILYLAARVIEPVPFDTLLDLTLCDDAVDYFRFFRVSGGSGKNRTPDSGRGERPLCHYGKGPAQQ